MLDITAYSVEFVKDPFGILEGKRYEFILDIDLDEEDELYSPHGLYIRAIYSEAPDRSGLVKYDLYERTTDRYLDYDLEEEEAEALERFCREHWSEAEGS